MFTNLTPREKDMIEYIVEGYTNKELANKFNISPHTVKALLEKIFDKLEIKNRVQLAAWALREGIFK